MVASLDGLLARAALDALAQVARFMYDGFWRSWSFCHRLRLSVGQPCREDRRWFEELGCCWWSTRHFLKSTSTAFVGVWLLGLLGRVGERVGEVGRLFLCVEVGRVPFRMYWIVGLTRPSQFSMGDAERDN